MTWNVMSQEEGTLGPLTEPCGDSRGEPKLPCERGLRLGGAKVTWTSLLPGEIGVPAAQGIQGCS